MITLTIESDALLPSARLKYIKKIYRTDAWRAIHLAEEMVEEFSDATLTRSGVRHILEGRAKEESVGNKLHITLETKHFSAGVTTRK